MKVAMTLTGAKSISEITHIEHKGHLKRSNGDNLVHFVRLSMEI